MKRIGRPDLLCSHPRPTWRSYTWLGQKEEAFGWLEIVASTLTLEVLHCSLMLFGRFARIKRPQVSPLPGFRVLLLRVKPVFA
jgi:hypothetical protein